MLKYSVKLTNIMWSKGDEIMESIKPICIDIAKRIVKQQTELCQICISVYGEDHERTKHQLQLLGKYSVALYNYQNQGK